MKTKILSAACAFSLILFTQTAFSQTELISNGSFETGDLTDWAVSAVNGVDGGPNSCSENWIVLENSTTICSTVNNVFPSDGAFAAFTSFDSDVPNTEWILEQTVSIPNDITTASVIFTFDARINLGLGTPPTMSRAFRVELLQTDGTLIGEVWSLVYPAAPVDFLSTHIDETTDVMSMIDGFQGTDIVLKFSAFVPEVLTGPGKALVDNVSFLVDTDLGVNDNAFNNDISVYPNPANTFFEIKNNGNQELTFAKIFDLNGRLIRTIDLTQSSSNINVSNLANGLYFLEINSLNASTTERLIIK